jgi:hypothetical protein
MVDYSKQLPDHVFTWSFGVNCRILTQFDTNIVGIIKLLIMKALNLDHISVSLGTREIEQVRYLESSKASCALAYEAAVVA